MSYSDMGIMVCVLLIILSLLSFACGIQYYRKNPDAKRLRIYILSMAVTAGVWCLGYGIIGLCPDFALIKAVRRVAVLGIEGYLFVEAALILYMNRLKPGLYKIILSMFGIILTVDWIMFSAPEVDTFTRIGNYTSFSQNPGFANTFHEITIGILGVGLVIFGGRLLVVTKLERERKFINFYILSNILLILATIPDTFATKLSMYQFSTSGMGAALAVFVLWYAAEKFEAFKDSDIMKAGDEIKLRIKYRQQFILTLIITFSVLSILDVLSFGSSYYQTKKDALSIGTYSAAQSAEKINNFLLTSRNVLETTAQTVNYMESKGQSEEEILDYLSVESTLYTEKIDKSFNGIYGCYRGDYIDGSGWTPPEGYDIYTRPWYLKAMEKAGIVDFTSPYIDAQTGDATISVCTLLDDGESVISMDVMLYSLQSVVDSINISDSNYSFVINKDGDIIAHTDTSLVGKKYTDTVDTSGNNEETIAEFENLKNQASGTSDTFEIKVSGDNNMVFSNAIQDCMVLITVANEAELFSDVKYSLYRNILLSLVIFLTVFIFCSMSYKNRVKALAAADSKSTFLANMSHEIRTPINAILGMNEMILKETGEKNIRDYATDIDSSGKLLLSLINDILDFSKIESGKMEIIPVNYSMLSLVNDLNSMIRPRAQKKGLELKIELAPDTPATLIGDEIRIRQIAVNLLTNAVKYTDKGTVTLNISCNSDGAQFEDDTKLIISVTDTGRGIKEEDRKKLFTSFTRVNEKQNRNIEGTGLGLSITDGFLKLMNGSMSVQSEYGKGSTFTATIPQRRSGTEVVGDAHTDFNAVEKRKVHDITFKAEGRKVLVVDDVKMNLKVIQNFLKHTGLAITTAGNGADAVALCAQEKFDLILMDHMMPGMDGIEALHHIKDEDTLNKDTVIIALTANAISGMREMYLNEGFSDYLSKPVDSKLLEDKLRKYIV